MKFKSPPRYRSGHLGFRRGSRPRLLPTGTCLLLIAVLLSACAQPLLNSERIERDFGSYGIEVLENSASKRVSNLYSLDGERRVTRTLALVLFDDSLNAAIATEHQLVAAGGSIGEVFKKNGWTIHKINLQLSSITATRDASLIAKLMGIALPAEIAMHVYRFQLQRGDESINYAIIAEIHHPDYLSVERLQVLYGAFPSESRPEPSLAAIETELRRILSK